MASTSEQSIATVARRLGDLKADVVFVGGAVLGLLLDDTGATPPRPTDDVDTIVDKTSKAQYDAMTLRLLALGFQPDTSEDAPLCRWIVEGVRVDIMPTSPEVLGFSNRWYPHAIRHAVEMEIEEGLTIRISTAPDFIAMKLEAFAHRGRGDFVASHDLEDVVAVVDGHEALVEEVEQSERALREYLVDRFGTLLDDESFVAAIPGHLAGDPASQARYSVVLDRLRRIARRVP